MKPYNCLVILLVLSIMANISCTSGPSNFEGGNPNTLPGGMRKADMSAPAATVLADEVMESPASFNEDGTSAILHHPVSRKIIKDASVMLIVKDLNKAKAGVDSLVRKYKAYYASESFNNTDYEHNYYLGIRIPAEHLDAFVTETEKNIGEIYNKSITARDVTEEFIDLETRLKNKRQYLDRYNQLLTQAKTIKDILEIQQKTREIEEEIESTTGRLRYLTSQVEYSTLNLQLSRKNEIVPGPDKGNFFERLKNSFTKGWRGLITFILFLIRLWPFWIIVSVTGYGLRKYLRHRKK